MMTTESQFNDVYTVYHQPEGEDSKTKSRNHAQEQMVKTNASFGEWKTSLDAVNDAV